jgi:hypothetical protein
VRGILVFFVFVASLAAEPYVVHDLLIGASSQYSRDPGWKPGKELALEVSGIDILPNGDPILCIRKGEVYIVKNAYGEGAPIFHRFASGLHEPLGVKVIDEQIYVTQRTEITQLKDRDGDGLADTYLSHGGQWGVSGNYHEYAYGPAMDGQGRMWVTLNIGMGKDASPYAPWRGWGGVIDEAGVFQPMCAGMRSPAGLAANALGDVFAIDHQGNWFGTCPLYRLREGAFYGHQESLAGLQLPGAPRMDLGTLANGVPFPEAVAKMPALVPPAVWFPYEKTARGLTGITLDDTDGAFGPFAGQFFIGEFTQAAICRVFLEKVNGEYQGACFRFREGFPSAVLCSTFGKAGHLFVGMSNRGWSSLGSASYGLQRLTYTGETPFEMKEMRATAKGFDLVFTQPVDVKTAMDPASYRMSAYTYKYHKGYGSPEIDTKDLVITPYALSPDGLQVHLQVDGRRELYVHELHADGIRNRAGQPLLHPDAYYTLNAIP